MTQEGLSSNEFLNSIVYDTTSAPFPSQKNWETATFLAENKNNSKSVRPQNEEVGALNSSSSLSLMTQHRQSGVGLEAIVDRKKYLAAQGRRKKRTKPRVKNKEEAETQRMTHIAVERNRRKLMNEHLAVLSSLMPESYVQRCDRAAILGGAIEFLKELEYLLQSLETQKLQVLEDGLSGRPNEDNNNSSEFLPPQVSQFFVYPQYTWSQFPNNKFTSKTKVAIADIEVTLIETHANLRILSRRSPRQLSKLVAGFQSLHLSILHLNVTTMDQLVLYSISAKVEEGCQLITVDDVAGAVDHMLRIIEEAAANVDGIGVLGCP